MNIGIFGTGIVGRTIAAKLASLGHDVMIGTRDVAKSLGLDQTDAMGNPPLRTWHTENSTVKLGTFADAAAHGELVINASSGAASLEVLRLAGEANLKGKVLVDISNPLDFSQGMPPSLFVANTDSLGEQIQRAYPEVKVVKTLNTLNAHLMVNPKSLTGGDHTVFLSGNDENAKTTVKVMLESFGWTDIFDLGDISTARGVEMILPIWLRAWGKLGNLPFQFKVVR